MSGTSLDGIDAALVELHPRRESYAVELRRFTTLPFADGLRARLTQALPPHAGSVAQTAALHAELGAAFAAAAESIAGGEPVDYVATHGLTLYHAGERGVTL